MTRPARAIIDTSALIHNLEQVRRLAPQQSVMAVVKANGYGHGIIAVARALEGADALAVASAQEGSVLREAGITQPICLLEGFFDEDELPLIVEKGFDCILHSHWQIQKLEQFPAKQTINVWLKINTGMNRLGFLPAESASLLSRLQACKNVGQVGLFSHLAKADLTESRLTLEQIDRFRKISPEGGLPQSLANSAGIVAWPESHLDWVRPGIMLYGASPVADRSAQELNLKPVMTAQSALIAVNQRRQGDAVGYGGDWTCPEDMPVGVVAFGYGDGYPRHAPSGTPVSVRGSRVPVIGRISMDMITVDLRQIPDAQVNDPVELWGPTIGIDEVATHAGTISYELMCHVTDRVPRIEINTK